MNFERQKKLSRNVLIAGVAATAIAGCSVEQSSGARNDTSSEHLATQILENGKVERKLEVTIQEGSNYYSSPAIARDTETGAHKPAGKLPEGMTLRVNNPVIVEGTDGKSYVATVVPAGDQKLQAPTNITEFSKSAALFPLAEVDHRYLPGADKEIPEIITSDTLPADADHLTLLDLE